MNPSETMKLSSTALPLEGVDASLFKSGHRLHVQGRDVFTLDHHLVINPKEASPENEPQLISKTIRHFSTIHPSFYSYPARANIALGLSSFVPVTPQARKEALIKQAQDVYVAEKTGTHPSDTAAALRSYNPMTSYIQNQQKKMEIGPVEKEQHINGLAAYLLVNEALHRKGFQKELSAYLPPSSSAEGMLMQVAKLLGTPYENLLSSLREQGTKGLAATLGIAPRVHEDILSVCTLASEHLFSANLIHNWLSGRSIDGLKDAPLNEIIEVGKMARTAQTIESVRKQLSAKDQSAIDADAIEDRMVSVIRDMPPALQQALYLSNTEISATPDHTVSPLLGYPETALGQHWFLPFTQGTNQGVRHLYISGADSIQRFSSVLMHEAHHLNFPATFTAAELADMDALLRSNAAHLKALNQLGEAWLVGTPEERKSVEAEINDQFMSKGGSLAQALGGQVTDAAMHRLIETTNHAVSELDPASLKLSRSYASPESRAAEMVSRFASIKYVDLRDAPSMLSYMCPDMQKLYQNYYLPHLERAVEQMRQAANETSMPAAGAAHSALPMADLAAGKFGHGSDPYDWSDEAPKLKISGHEAEVEHLISPLQKSMEPLDQSGFAARIASESPQAQHHATR